jgi:hypothetical protein
MAAGRRPRPRRPATRRRQPLPSDDARVDQLLAWLDLPSAERPSLLLGYFSDTDQAGHQHGPDSPEVKAAITTIDGVIGRLTAGLDARGLVQPAPNDGDPRITGRLPAATNLHKTH